MKYIKLYEQFKSHQDIDDICKKYDIKNYTINEDLSIDVDGFVDLSCKRLHELPLIFRKVSADFDCSHNKLISLKNGPSEVGGNYYCNNNKLTSLEGVPNKLLEDFNCSNNHLSSLEFVPNSIGGYFECYANPIYSFEYYPDFTGDYMSHLPNNLEYLLKLFGEKYNLIPLFGDYNIIKASTSFYTKPRLKLSNLNKFLSENGFKELEDTSILVQYYELK